MENLYLQRYIRGRGIEIGALWKRFPVPGRARVWYLDRLDGAALDEHYPELDGRILGPDLLGDAAELPLAPHSLDFVIASHVLEHLPYPLRALRSWYEALSPGGVLLIKVPDKRYTFDTRRQRTPLDHLLNETDDQREHYADWVAHVGNQSPDSPGFAEAVDDLMRRNYSIHFHVWIDDDIREIVEFTRTKWGLDWRLAAFWEAHWWRKETTVVLVRA
jgi:SAM-dependent methyltransferase